MALEKTLEFQTSVSNSFTRRKNLLGKQMPLEQATLVEVASKDLTRTSRGGAVSHRTVATRPFARISHQTNRVPLLTKTCQ